MQAREAARTQAPIFGQLVKGNLAAWSGRLALSWREEEFGSIFEVNGWIETRSEVTRKCEGDVGIGLAEKREVWRGWWRRGLRLEVRILTALIP